MRFFLALTVLLLVLLPGPAAAQSDIPVVYGVFFYSPTCPHCHLVMENDFPRMQAEFGDQFQILYVNVQTQGGNVLFQSAYRAPNIAVNSLGVPTLVIGQEVMVGSVDIPARAFDIIRQGLANGGIGLPGIPGLHEAYMATLAGAQASGVVQGPSASVSGGGLDAADLIAGTVLTLLTTSLIMVIGGAVRSLRGRWRVVSSPVPWFAALGTAALAVVVGLTLVAEALLSPLVLVVALVEIGALAAVVLLLWKHRTRGSLFALRLPDRLLPLAVLSGLAVAIYLSYVEITQSDAVCGLVGNCNLVQQSEYARLFGLVPVGLFGVVGYLVILALWFASTRQDGPTAHYTRLLLLGAALFGVAFSIYLTVLELFVINAVCMWCITSALVSLLILWLVTGTGLESLRALRQPRAA